MTNKKKRTKDELIHIRVGVGIREKMMELIDNGFFTNQTELVREAIRDLILKYQSFTKYQSPNHNSNSKQKEEQIIEQRRGQKREDKSSIRRERNK